MRTWVEVRGRAVVCACGVAAGCGGDPQSPDAGLYDAAIDADEGTGFRVTVEIIGVRDPMPLVLRHDPDPDQQILITEDSGSALQRFPRRLVDGASFTVIPGGAQSCLPAVATGQIAGEDAIVAFTCGGGVVDLQSFGSTVPIRLQPRFDPRVATYQGFAPLLREPADLMAITPVPMYPDATVAIAPGPQLRVDTPALQLTLAHPNATDRTYTVALSRRLLQEAYGKASDTAAGARLGGIQQDSARIGGAGVAVSGNTIVVGAPGGAGAAYVFVRTGVKWKLEARISPPVPNTSFGIAVAIDGDKLVVGAPGDGAGGAAYAYVRSGASWSQQAVLRPAALTAGALCGATVAIAGAYLVVGAPLQSSNSGAAFVYDTAAWGLATTLPATPIANARFGAAVAITGTTLAIGAPTEASAQGAAYAYVAGTWQQTRFAGPATSSVFFGMSLGIDGDLLVVGAPFESPGGNPSGGTARVFVRTGGVWAITASQTLTGGSSANFGSAVAVDRGHVIVGAPNEDSTAINSGAVYFFRCTSGPCAVEASPVKAANADPNDQLGLSVAVDDDTVLAAAPFEDSASSNPANNGALDAGAIYVFR